MVSDAFFIVFVRDCLWSYNIVGGSNSALFRQILRMPIVFRLVLCAEFENHTYFG